MARTFYGYLHTYGSQVADARGRSVGQVYRFATKAARDRWVSLGPDYTTAPRYRQPISATSREVRSATRADYLSVEDGDAALAESLDYSAESDPSTP